MASSNRRLLEELMSPFEGTKKDFRDRKVCKAYLVEFCPNMLFLNTKADIGPCDLIHEEALKIQYQNSDDKVKYGYEENFFYKLQSILSDLDRKIKRAFNRVTAEADENLVNPEKDENQEKIVLAEEKIKAMLEKIEKAGEEGRVEEAQNLTVELEALQGELFNLKEKASAVNPLFKNEKKLEVCDVCGAFLVPGDDTRRLDAHVEGKQHQGYLKIRECYEELKVS
ncbi:hypothetical protein BB560_004942 [Smittium megazygosporum]|uniref:Uncharacterized protein n=1 Tax=Smittium megazygosporum TaxID=133381 RepID=A0A2T9Z7Z7_9FUNG|nr:hypothetical protein BB560_004942 [Smittium megazygosporum]